MPSYTPHLHTMAYASAIGGKIVFFLTCKVPIAQVRLDVAGGYSCSVLLRGEEVSNSPFELTVRGEGVASKQLPPS